MSVSEESVETLVLRVKATGKYHSISDDFVRTIGQKELAKRSSLKEAVKATRNKLHQVGSAYQEKPIPYETWSDELTRLPKDINHPLVKQHILRNQTAHSSTQERIQILPSFFNEILKAISPIESILDLACGLTPLSIPWMPLKANFRYTGCDVYLDMITYLNQFLNHFGISGEISACDLTQSIPQDPVQLALILKTIPCLEQVEKSAGLSLLDGVNAKFMLVSFPALSLGGRSKGMRENYETHFYELIAGKPWKTTRFDFQNELAFLIEK